MSGLPEIVRGGVRYRLRLTPEAATCLAGALLADGQADRLGWLACGLTHDPPLALWCALEAPEPPTETSITAALSHWLAGRLTSDFAQPPAAETAVISGKRSARVQELLTRSRAVAHKASESAGADADTALVALLHRAVDWLMLSGTPRPKSKDAAAVLPHWLASSLARLKKPADCPPGSIEARVRAAIAACANGARDHDYGRRASPYRLTLGFDGPNSNGPHAQNKIWSLGPDSLSQFIPLLAAQAARIERLGADFDRALEHAKLEALKEFAYGAGHEINNPLANISVRAQTLLKEESDPERRQKLAAINTQAFRAHEMIADLMLFARPPEMKPERIALTSFLTQLATTWRDEAAQQQTDIELHWPDAAERDELTVWADSDSLSVALRALITNALEALGHGGRVELAARARLPASGQKPTQDSAAVEISVRDNGPGIPAEIRNRIFDPYFSGREAGRGLGFGLCKCWRIVTAQGGRIEVASDVGAGATFSITLPAAGN